jgi:hypothetical protein
MDCKSSTFESISKQFELNDFEVMEFEEYLSKKLIGRNSNKEILEKAYYSWLMGDDDEDSSRDS